MKPLGATLYQQTASYRMGKDSTDPGFVVVSRLWSLPRLRNLTGIEIRIRLESIFLGNPNPNRNSNEQTKGIWIRIQIGMLNVEFVCESKIWLLDSNSYKKFLEIPSVIDGHTLDDPGILFAVILRCRLAFFASSGGNRNPNQNR